MQNRCSYSWLSNYSFIIQPQNTASIQASKSDCMHIKLRCLWHLEVNFPHWIVSGYVAQKVFPQSMNHSGQQEHGFYFYRISPINALGAEAYKEPLSMSCFDQIHNMNPSIPSLYAMEMSLGYINYWLRYVGLNSEVGGGAHLFKQANLVGEIQYKTRMLRLSRDQLQCLAWSAISIVMQLALCSMRSSVMSEHVSSCIYRPFTCSNNTFSPAI